MFSRKKNKKPKQKHLKPGFVQGEAAPKRLVTKKRVTIVGIVVLVLVLGFGAYYFIQRGSQDDATQNEELTTEELVQQVIDDYEANKQNPASQAQTPQQRLDSIKAQLEEPQTGEGQGEGSNLELYIDGAFTADGLGQEALAKEYATKALEIFKVQQPGTREAYATVIQSLQRIADE